MTDVHHPSSKFAEELEKTPHGGEINKCVQCGICTASCMVAQYDEKYRPRKLIQKILLGMREEVLTSELPWLCMTCRMCEDRCQEGVSIPDLLHAVRELAAKEGHIPNTFQRMTDTVLEDGWILKDAYSDFIEEEREDLGLRADLDWNNEFSRKVKERFYGK